MATITPEQRQEIENAGDEQVRVEDPQTRAKYVLVKQEIYDRMRSSPRRRRDRPVAFFEFGDFEPL